MTTRSTAAESPAPPAVPSPAPSSARPCSAPPWRPVCAALARTGAWWRALRHRRPWGARHGGRAPDLGMATAEYAIATLAACGFAGLLLALMRSDEVRTLLSGVIRRALSIT